METAPEARQRAIADFGGAPELEKPMPIEVE